MLIKSKVRIDLNSIPKKFPAVIMLDTYIHSNREIKSTQNYKNFTNPKNKSTRNMAKFPFAKIDLHKVIAFYINNTEHYINNPSSVKVQSNPDSHRKVNLIK